MSDRKDPSVLALIPARGGSKRIPRKNILALGGKPLIAYTIECALACKSVDKVVVSTDDNEIAELARRCGAEVPFMRPADIAQDTTPDLPVFKHALNWLQENQAYTPDLVLNLRPTAPFRTPELVQGLIDKWRESGADSVRSMSKAEGIQHPYWMFKEENGLASPVVEGESIDKYYQSQLLPPVYHLNGVVDGISADVILNTEKLYGESMAIYETASEFSLDIDTPEDFELAEFLLSRSS